MAEQKLKRVRLLVVQLVAAALILHFHPLCAGAFPSHNDSFTAGYFPKDGNVANANHIIGGHMDGSTTIATHWNLFNACKFLRFPDLVIFSRWDQNGKIAKCSAGLLFDTNDNWRRMWLPLEDLYEALVLRAAEVLAVHLNYSDVGTPMGNRTRFHLDYSNGIISTTTDYKRDYTFDPREIFPALDIS